MSRTWITLACALLLSSCSPDGQQASPADKCAAEAFPSYNPSDLKQCVAACIKCQNGATTTCTTSCTLKGAH
jgi:hypothetical protein